VSAAVLSTNSKMVDLLWELAPKEGYTNSRLEAVRFMRANSTMQRAPVIYEPSIVIVAQGRKHGFVGDQSFIYDANNYLVLSVPLPFECETQASPTSPMLAIKIGVDPTVIAELMLEMEDTRPPSGDVLSGVAATPLTEDLLNATIRLLECLSSPTEARILGPQIIREITFRVLCGEHGDSLKALVTRRSKFAQIAKTLRRIHIDFNGKLDVESLAEEADMSVSAFHHNFKIVTSTAPLQYIKSVRLHKARTLMVYEGLNANTAASRVGYESASQFSREFKRMFGSSPAEEAARMKARFA
jgi:AraC-like DNA-binding protein